MGGFGHGPMGRGPFGESDWGTAVFWSSLPDAHREYDKNNGDALYKFVMGLADATDLVRRNARRFPDQRDPRRVQTRHAYNEAVTIDEDETLFVSASESANGRAYMEIMLLTGDISRVAPGWLLVAQNRAYSVFGVRKADGAGVTPGTLLVYGDTLPTGTMYVRPPEVISFLGRDFGVEVDGNEPEFFQRSTVYDAVKWYNQKGTSLGIQLRASVAGFQATVKSLYRIDSSYVSSIDTQDVFEIPEGSGAWYTNVRPRVVRFDEIMADLLPLDHDCTSGDPSIGATTVVSVTDLGDGTVRVDFDDDTLLPILSAESIDGWYLYGPDSAGNDTEVFFDAIGSGSSHPYIVVPADAEPELDDYDVRYRCSLNVECGWCQTHSVRIELVVTDPTLLADSAALEGAFDRLIRKLGGLIPAHVDIAQLVFVAESTATITLTSTVTSETWTMDLFDDAAADSQSLDGYTVTSQ